MNIFTREDLHKRCRMGGCEKGRVISMKKSEIILLSACSFLLGLVIGFLAAPIKKGIDIGNNCGNTTNHNYDCGEERDEYHFN
jgi:hypothetical protein